MRVEGLCDAGGRAEASHMSPRVGLSVSDQKNDMTCMFSLISIYRFEFEGVCRVKAITRISIFRKALRPEVLVILRAGGGRAPEASHTKPQTKYMLIYIYIYIYISARYGDLIWPGSISRLRGPG